MSYAGWGFTMNKAQLESLIQKRMEQCVRDDYLIKNQLVATPATLASPSPLHDRRCEAGTITANVQQVAESQPQPIQNQVDNSNNNNVNPSFTEQYVSNIYNFFYQLIHHEKYHYMDDYISNFSNNIEQATLNINGNSLLHSYAILKPIIQKLKNKQSCNAGSDECNSNSKTITTSVDIFGFFVLIIKITIYLIQSGYYKKSVAVDGESNVDCMIGAKYEKKLDKLFDYCFNEIKSAFLSEQLIDNLTSLQNISKKTYDYNDFLIYWKSNFNYIQSVVRDILDFDKQTIHKLLTLVSNENQLLDSASQESEAASLLEQLIHKRIEMIILWFHVEMINHME